MMIHFSAAAFAVLLALIVASAMLDTLQRGIS